MLVSLIIGYMRRKPVGMHGMSIDVLSFSLFSASLSWLIGSIMFPEKILLFYIITSTIALLFLFYMLVEVTSRMRREPLVLFKGFLTFTFIASLLATLLTYHERLTTPVDLIELVILKLNTYFNIATWPLRMLYAIFISLPGIVTGSRNKVSTFDYLASAFMFPIVASLAIPVTTYLMTCLYLWGIGIIMVNYASYINRLLDFIITMTNVFILALKLPYLPRIVELLYPREAMTLSKKSYRGLLPVELIATATKLYVIMHYM